MTMPKPHLLIGIAIFSILGLLALVYVSAAAANSNSLEAESATTSGADLTKEDAEASNSKYILFDEAGLMADGIDWNQLPTTDIKLSDEVLTITEPGTYTITGVSTSSIVVNSEGNIRLALNGVKITSSSGAAINVQDADSTVIYLVEGSENYLEDSDSRIDEDIDGTIYSADDLIFLGTGKLSVVSNFADGIVSKDDLNIYDGTIIVDSVDEGLRGKDSILITGGTIFVTADDDGIKSSEDEDLEKGYIHITGGSVTIEAADDAIKAVTSITIDGGIINVTGSYEGMEATNITINDGDVTIVASDDGINAVSDGLGGDVFIAVNGGKVDVTVGSGDTDAFDSNGAIYVRGGDINVTAPTSSFDYDTTAEMTGGTITVNGEVLDDIPAGMTGRPRN